MSTSTSSIQNQPRTRVEYPDPSTPNAKHLLKTELWIFEPNTPTEHSGRLMNTITPFSTFRHRSNRTSLDGPEARELCAKQLIEGWVMNGNKRDCKFLIKHC